jgi:hypothetical protein
MCQGNMGEIGNIGETLGAIMAPGSVALLQGFSQEIALRSVSVAGPIFRPSVHTQGNKLSRFTGPLQVYLLGPTPRLDFLLGLTNGDDDRPDVSMCQWFFRYFYSAARRGTFPERGTCPSPSSLTA